MFLQQSLCVLSPQSFLTLAQNSMPFFRIYSALKVQYNYVITLKRPFRQLSATKTISMALFNGEQYTLDAASTTMRFSTMTISASATQRNDSLEPGRTSVQQEGRPDLDGYPSEPAPTRYSMTLPPPGFSTVPLFKHTLRACMITPGSNLDRCTLTDVNGDGCQLTGCLIMSETLVPKLWNCTLIDCTIMDVEIRGCEIRSTFGKEIHDPTERHFNIAGELFRQGGASQLKRCQITNTKIVHAQAKNCWLEHVEAKYLIAKMCEFQYCKLLTCELRESSSHSGEISEGTSSVDAGPSIAFTSSGNDIQLLNLFITPPKADPSAHIDQFDSDSVRYPAQRRKREDNVDNIRMMQGQQPLALGYLEDQRRHMLTEVLHEAVAAVDVTDYRDTLCTMRRSPENVPSRKDVVELDRSRHRSAWQRMMGGDASF
ncbi:hypothetical protein AC579_7470 [Pseudocercospora musae]|uniref:Uncharacterized protein n=1 Tax=Pseudocercospora musae TaxID=113226 RepID=A0A139ICQ4_9PEZI|nr:hypothetical protein AC579_7470 [Pseudocercospora musae]